MTEELKEIKDPEDIGSRLKYWRKIKKLKAKDLAEILKIAPVRLSEYETNKVSPSAETIEKIIRLTDINITWLLTGEGSIYRVEDKKSDDFDYKINGLSVSVKPFEEMFVFNNKEIEHQDLVYIPRLDNILKDPNSLNISINKDDCCAFKQSYFKKLKKDPSHFVYIIIKWDSMEPTLLNGDRVLVDTIDKQITDGIYAFTQFDKIVYIKRLEKRGCSVRIVSDNQIKYQPYDLKIAEIKIIGKVIGLYRFFYTPE